MAPRKDGFYWVRYLGDEPSPAKGWLVAQYGGPSAPGEWRVPDQDGLIHFYEAGGEFRDFQVGPLVEPPNTVPVPVNLSPPVLILEHVSMDEFVRRIVYLWASDSSMPPDVFTDSYLSDQLERLRWAPRITHGDPTLAAIVARAVDRVLGNQEERRGPDA